MKPRVSPRVSGASPWDPHSPRDVGMYLSLHRLTVTRAHHLVPWGSGTPFPAPCHLYCGIRSTGLAGFREAKAEHRPVDKCPAVGSVLVLCKRSFPEKPSWLQRGAHYGQQLVSVLRAGPSPGEPGSPVLSEEGAKPQGGAEEVTFHSGWRWTEPC